MRKESVDCGCMMDSWLSASHFDMHDASAFKLR